MSTQPFFTIIVPHHRTEAFLEQNLNSIKSQSFKDFECLVINDGSPGVELDKFTDNQDPDFYHSVDLKGVSLKDQTEKIFNDLVGDDSRFKLFYKEQGGTASARNFAFTKMTGKWALCVDADDWILEDHLQKFYEGLEKNKDKLYPIICFLFLRYYNTGVEHKVRYQKKITLANLLYTQVLIEWNMLWHVDIIKEFNLKNDTRFGPGPATKDKIIKHGYDDMLFAWMYVNAVQKKVGKKNLSFYDTKQKTYMYRDLNSFKKNLLKGSNSQLIYIKFLSDYAMTNSSDWQVKISSILAPIYVSMFDSKNFIKKYFIKRLIGVTLKFLTRYYF